MAVPRLKGRRTYPGVPSELRLEYMEVKGSRLGREAERGEGEGRVFQVKGGVYVKIQKQPGTAEKLKCSCAVWDLVNCLFLAGKLKKAHAWAGSYRKFRFE